MANACRLLYLNQHAFLRFQITNFTLIAICLFVMIRLTSSLLAATFYLIFSLIIDLIEPIEFHLTF